jgi:Zn-dependent alcohol dehydrogenase
MVDLRSGHGPRALVTLHSADCPECRRYVRVDLASGPDRLAEWGGRLAVVVPGQVESANELAKITRRAMQVLGDPEGELASGRAMVVITDEWGEVYFVADAGAGHDLPTLVEIGDWVRFLAIQCPECEGPEGEWRTVDIRRL